MEIKNVTFIGLGVMGYNMAGHLIKNNFNTTVYNRTSSVAEKRINEFSGISETTPGKASSNADIVFICVGRDEDLISVMEGNDGIIKNIKKAVGQVVIHEQERKGTKQYVLEMLPKYQDKRYFVSTLGHEMVHLYQMQNLGDTGNHNQLFYSFQPKLNQIGLTI